MARSKSAHLAPSSAAAASAAASSAPQKDVPAFDLFAVQKPLNRVMVPIIEVIQKEKRKSAAARRPSTAEERKQERLKLAAKKFDDALTRDRISRRLQNRGNAFKKPHSKAVTYKDKNGVEKKRPNMPGLRIAQFGRLVKEIAWESNDGKDVRVGRDLLEQIGNDAVCVRLAREIFPDAQQRRVDVSPHSTREELDEHFLVDRISTRHLESAIRLNLQHHQRTNPGSNELETFEQVLEQLRAETAARNAAKASKTKEKTEIKDIIARTTKPYLALKQGGASSMSKEAKIEVYNDIRRLCHLQAARVDRIIEEVNGKVSAARDSIRAIQKRLIPKAQDESLKLRALISSPETGVEEGDETPVEERVAKNKALLAKKQEYILNRQKEVEELQLRIAKYEEKAAKAQQEKDSFKKEAKAAKKHHKNLGGEDDMEIDE